MIINSLLKEETLGLPTEAREKNLFHFYIVAGEASGDQIGSQLLKVLKSYGKVSGVGGPQMEAQNFQSLFPLSDLSVMGLWEVIPALPRIFKRLRQVEADIIAKKPHAVVTIDSPGFTFHLGKKLKKRGIPVIHYVAPSVWAWRPGRAKKISKFLTHLLTLFPFEPSYFEREGLPTTFVGHPLIEMNFNPDQAQGFRERWGYTSTQTLICLLPGSRQGEVKKLLPIFLKALELLRESKPDLQIVLPVVPSLKGLIEQLIKDISLPIQLIIDFEEKKAAMAASDGALAASGTVALELGLVETPMVIAYKIHPLTAWIVRKLLRSPYVCLINILLNQKIVPELLQENCTPPKICQSLIEELQGKQKENLKEIRSLLGSPSQKPSKKAAEIIMSYAIQNIESGKMVGAAGFEPTTPTPPV